MSGRDNRAAPSRNEKIQGSQRNANGGDEQRASCQTAGKQPPSPLAVDPERHENVDEAKPCKGQEQQRSERDERAVEKTDVAKGHRTQHPGIAAPARPDRKTVRLRMKEKADDKMRQLVGDRAGKREQRDTPHGVAHTTQ